MFDLLIPDIYDQSIYTINYKKLKKNGIKCLLFDLDNTIAPYMLMLLLVAENHLKRNIKRYLLYTNLRLMK